MIAFELFGFAGMLLGVPVFAVLYMLVTELINSRLQARGRTTDTAAYQTIRTVEELELDGQISMEETETNR